MLGLFPLIRTEGVIVTKDLKSLRDARHLEKYIYTLSHKLFYEPFDTQYTPSEEYLSVVRAVLNDCGKDWTISRDGIWFNARPKQCSHPLQGWKVHVSATLANSVDILRKTARIASINQVPFKFALDKNVLGMIGFKRTRR